MQTNNQEMNRAQIIIRLLTTNFSRAFGWNIPKSVELTEDEEEKINKECGTLHSLDNPEKFQKLIAWRAALMTATIPFGLLLTGLKIYRTTETFDYYSESEEYYNLDFDILTSLGKAALISNDVLGELLLIVGLCLAMYYRFNLPKSSIIIRWSFLLLLFMKLWPTLLQSDAKYALGDIVEYWDASDSEALGLVAQLRFQGTLMNITELMPLIIAFPRGAIGTAMALLALIPNAVTPRILLLFFFPFATLLLVLGTSSMVQLAGDFFLALSLGCFYVSDFLIYAMVDAINTSNIEELSNSAKAKARIFFKILGSVFLVVWIFVKLAPCLLSDDSDDEAECQALGLLSFTAIRVVNILFSFLRNLFLTKLVFADFIIPTIVRCEPGVTGLDHIYSAANQIPHHHKVSQEEESANEEESSNKQNRDEETGIIKDNHDEDSGEKESLDEDEETP